MIRIVSFALSSITTFYITKSILRKNKFHSELKNDARTPEAEEIVKKTKSETEEGNFNGNSGYNVNKRIGNPLHQFQKVETTSFRNIQYEQETNLHQGKNVNDFKNINSKTSLRRNPIRKTSTPYIDVELVNVKIIKSEPDPNHLEPKRIGFTPTDNFSQNEPYQYAVVKMPLLNSLIKFPRKGRSDKKGFKEDDFKLFLEKYFSSQYKVLMTGIFLLRMEGLMSLILLYPMKRMEKTFS